jgi:hypothetical protein
VIGPKTATSHAAGCHAVAVCVRPVIADVVTRYQVTEIDPKTRELAKPYRLFADPVCAVHAAEYMARMIARDPSVVALRSLNEQEGTVPA